MDAAELAVHRSNTTAFIGANPTEVTLIPKVGKVKTASGGWTNADATPRAAQTMRIIELGRNTAPPTIRTQDGTVREVRFWLLGEHDAVMEPEDHWTSADDREWEVADVIRSNGYETRGIVVEYGRG